METKELGMYFCETDMTGMNVFFKQKPLLLILDLTATYINLTYFVLLNFTRDVVARLLDLFSC